MNTCQTDMRVQWPAGVSQLLCNLLWFLSHMSVNFTGCVFYCRVASFPPAAILLFLIPSLPTTLTQHFIALTEFHNFTESCWCRIRIWGVKCIQNQHTDAGLLEQQPCFYWRGQLLLTPNAVTCDPPSYLFSLVCSSTSCPVRHKCSRIGICWFTPECWKRTGLQTRTKLILCLLKRVTPWHNVHCWFKLIFSQFLASCMKKWLLCIFYYSFCHHSLKAAFG